MCPVRNRLSSILSILLLSPGILPAADGEEQPLLRLRVAVNDIYGRETACACVHDTARRTYGDFTARLHAEHRIVLELVPYKEPLLLSRDFKAEKFDGAICKPWLLMRLPGGTNLVRLADLRDPGGQASLWGLILVKKESPFQALGAVTNARLALGEADGYEKHQAVRRLLEKTPSAFPPARRVERSSCLECLDLLARGEVDAAAVSHYSLAADCAVDAYNPADFRVLAETEKIPLTSFLIDPARVSGVEADRLRKALLDVSAKDLPASMAGGGFIPPAPWAPADPVGLP